jgi:hypothetical protein
MALDIDDHPAQRPLEGVFHTVDQLWMWRQRSRFHKMISAIASNVQDMPALAVVDLRTSVMSELNSLPGFDFVLLASLQPDRKGFEGLGRGQFSELLDHT